jgi:hypothetical protein
LGLSAGVSRVARACPYSSSSVSGSERATKMTTGVKHDRETHPRRDLKWPPSGPGALILRDIVTLLDSEQTIARVR